MTYTAYMSNIHHSYIMLPANDITHAYPHRTCATHVLMHLTCAMHVPAYAIHSTSAPHRTCVSDRHVHMRAATSEHEETETDSDT